MEGARSTFVDGSRGCFGENELLEIEVWDRPKGMGYFQYITEDGHRPKMTAKKLYSHVPWSNSH